MQEDSRSEAEVVAQGPTYSAVCGATWEAKWRSVLEHRTATATAAAIDSGTARARKVCVIELKQMRHGCASVRYKCMQVCAV